MPKEDIFKQVQNLLNEQLGIEKEKITLESKLFEDIGADELDTVEFIISSEEEFGIAIPEEDTEGLKTIGEWVDYFAKRLK